MISVLNHFAWFRARPLVLGMLLLSLPACGTSAYEARMRETQERADLYLEEEQYLAGPVRMPTHKVKSDTEKEAHEEPVADVFFRPPKGIEVGPEAVNSLLWRYPSRTSTNFTRVEIAFASGNKNFAREVLNSLASVQLSGPQRHPSLPFDTYEGSDAQNGYSVDILNSANAQAQVAIVYVFPKDRRRNLAKAIDVSLRSLAVDEQAVAARKRNKIKSPWRLSGPLSP